MPNAPVSTESSPCLLQVLPYLSADNPSLAGIREEASRAVNNALQEFGIWKPISSNRLPINTNLASNIKITQAQTQLMSALEELSSIHKWQSPIKIIADKCFTNRLLRRSIRDILGEEWFNKYVQCLDVDYANMENTPNIIHYTPQFANSLIILGGSFDDTYAVDQKLYQSKFADFIAKTCQDDALHNNRLLGICFGHQLIISILKKQQWREMTTIKWPAQFTPSRCIIRSDIDKTTRDFSLFRRAFAWLWNDGKNNGEFTALFTRSGYPLFLNDINRIKEYLNIVSLMVDDMTGTIAAWGLKNQRVIGVQPHFEIRPQEDLAFLEQGLESAIPVLQRDYGNKALSILENYRSATHVQPVDRHFYTFALLAFVQDILTKQTIH